MPTAGPLNMVASVHTGLAKTQIGTSIPAFSSLLIYTQEGIAESYDDSV